MLARVLRCARSNRERKEFDLEIQELFQELNLSPAQIAEFTETIKTNPMAALSLIQKFNIKPELIQKLMGILMANPGALQEISSKMGLADDMVDKVQEHLKTQKPNGKMEKD